MNIKDIIPIDWKIVNLSEITELITKGTTPTTNGYPYLDDGVNFVKVESIHANGTLIPKMFAHVGEDCHDSFKRSQLRNNDILFTIAGALGRSAIVNNKILPANTNQAVAIIRLKNVEYLNYIFHYLRGSYVKNLIDKINVSTAQANLNLGQINQFEIPLPPHPEQQKIAEILSTVDDKIEVINQQITQTQELKKGLMQRLLTKGIGHTEFKDSPLGEIPKSWEAVELVNNIKLLSGFAFKSDSFNEKGLGIKLLRGINITVGKLRWNDKLDRWWDLPFEEIKKYSAQVGDLVISMDGSLVGRNYARVKEEDLPLLIVQRVACLRAKSTLDLEYLNQIIGSPLWLNYVDAVKTSSGIPHISAKNIREFKIPFPSIDEQNKIASILASVDDKLEVLLQKKTHYQELKQGLMQQLLTGKIRVKV